MRSNLQVLFEVAGTRVRVDGFPVPEHPFLPEHYPGFYRLGPEPADLVLECRVDPGAPCLPAPPPGTHPVVTVEAEEGEVLTTVSHWHRAEADLATGKGRTTFADLTHLRFRMSLENLLRTLFANLLIRRNAALLHGAGIVRDGKAHVFFALAGGGKSTIARLSRPLPALSDDLVVLALGKDGLETERVPFFGEFPSKDRLEGRFPVVSLLHLERGKSHEIVPLPRIHQVMHLRSCLPFLPPADERALTFAEDASRALPVRELRFAPDAGFWDLLPP